ncbi:MAG: hypothetical protein Q8O72_08560 [Bacteroidales bacterium]|nr:hypothetical protein [Bacteroidales bacterium]
MRILIGIDDTDNKESRGTGYNARQLAAAIEINGLGKVRGITRHQLLVHPDIPYTSQNSSACLDVDSNDLRGLKAFARDFMLSVGAIGSDVGLCIVEKERVPEEIIQWGLDAKSIVLKINTAIEKAEKQDIYLVGLTGTHGGVIGALAGVGLRAGGNDGRFIWINSEKNLRDIEQGVHNIELLHHMAGIDEIQCHGEVVSNPTDRVWLNGWARPVLKNHKSVLLVDKELNNTNYEWKCSAKESVRLVSN